MISYVTYEEYNFDGESLRKTVYAGNDIQRAMDFESEGKLILETWVDGNVVRRQNKQPEDNWVVTYDRVIHLENNIKRLEEELIKSKTELEGILKSMEV